MAELGLDPQVKLLTSISITIWVQNDNFLFRSVFFALPSCLVCATRSLSHLGRVGTACTNMSPMGPSTKSSPTSQEGEASEWVSIQNISAVLCRANENGGLLGKVEKEKKLLKSELIARIKVISCV